MPTVKEKLDAMNNLHLEKIHPAITFENGKLTAQLQVGHPTESDAISGCFNTHVLDALIILQKHYQNILPCEENQQVVTKLVEARLWLEKRKLDREQRGVLQTDNK